MSQSVAILAAGGTGGHMFPAQAVADVLLALGWRVILTTDDRGMRYADGFDDSIDRVILPTGSFSQGSILRRMSALLRILQGINKARKLFRTHKPRAVIGFGGYPSFPSLMMARLTGATYYIHEQNAVLGRVNKIFHTRAHTVACGMWPVLHAGDNATYLGNPVRSHILALANTPLPSNDKLGLVVFGGSQGASIFSKLLPAAIAALPETTRAKLHITQQARKSEIADLQSFYADLGVTADVSDFFTDLPERISAAHFVVARSGASTIAELQLIGRGSMLVPFPSAMNDHQRLNAKALVGAGAAELFDETTGSPDDFAKQFAAIMTDTDKLTQMAAAAHELARANAAQDFVKLINH